MEDTRGAVCWSELWTRDAERAKAFYHDICGWEYENMPMQNGDGIYFVAKSGGRPVAGILDLTRGQGMAALQPRWVTYVDVADVDALALRIEESGGKVMRPPFDISDVGRILMVTDPDGTPLGLMTPAEGDGD